MQTLLQCRNTDTGAKGVAYFFCNRNEPHRRDPEFVIRTLIKQLCLRSETLFSLLAKEYERQEQTGFAYGALDFPRCQELIIDCLKRLTHTSIVVDALDECNRDTRLLLLKSLQSICIACPGRVNIFVSSRNDGDIVLELEGVPNHYIQPSDNADDIAKFVKAKVESAIDTRRLLRGRVAPELKERIINELTVNARGMYVESHSFHRIACELILWYRFLWTAFQIDSLCSMSLESDVKIKLGRLPMTMKGTYDEIYSMIQAEHDMARKAAETALKWIMTAYRPLTPKEVFSAMLQAGIPDIQDVDLILQICHNFVVLDQELGVLRLSHLSVREYLEIYHLPDFDGQKFVSLGCLQFLDSGDWSEEQSTFVLKDYAILHWPFHVQASEQAKDDCRLQNGLQSFLGSHGETSQSFGRWYIDAWTLLRSTPILKRATMKIAPFLYQIERNPPSPLLVAVVFGYRQYLERVQDLGGLNVTVTNLHGEGLLMLASRLGMDGLLPLLISAGCDVNAKVDSDFSLHATALQAAAIGGYHPTIKILLEAGAEVDAFGGRYGSALQAAAYYGHQSVVKILHDRGASLRANCGYYGNAMQAAACSGNESLLKFIIDLGAGVNEKAGKLGSALTFATEKGHTKIVEYLIMKGADVNAEAGIYGSALHVAALWGLEQIAVILLQSGADPNSWDASARTPFHETATKGFSTAMMDLLLENGADPRAMDDAGWTTLDEANWRGRQDLVDYLEARGIYAWQDPPECPLPSKDRPILVRSALQEAFRDMRKDDKLWYEYTLPILRFSLFYLEKPNLASRACREISRRWGWTCDHCKLESSGQPQFACTACHSTNLCVSCYDTREGSGIFLKICSPNHKFLGIGTEIEGPGIWDWLVSVRDVLKQEGQLETKRRELMRFDKNRRKWVR